MITWIKSKLSRFIPKPATEEELYEQVEKSLRRAASNIADAVQACIDKGYLDKDGNVTEKGREHIAAPRSKGK